MQSRESYQESYDYLNSIKKNLNTGDIKIEVKKLDEKSKAELIDLLNKFCIRRTSEIYNNILSGVNTF